MACLASVSIHKGTYSVPFRVSEINTNTVLELRGTVKINFPLQIGLNASGEMQEIPSISGIFWPKLIDIASDCHDQNVKLCRWNNDKETLVLQTIRDITIGQKLQMWFSDDLMVSDLGIPPYLSPVNIKGGNCYVCHECHEEFERPNTLKLHLALHCDRLSLDTIWNRLKAMGTSPLLINPSYFVNLSPSSSVSLLSSSSSPYPLMTISPTPAPVVSSTSSPSHPQTRHHDLIGIPESRHNNNNKGPLVASSSTHSPVSHAPVEVPPTTVEPETSSGRNLVVQDQHHHHARLEAIVSNMGKAKNGHVCLYCGKLYSRKYGLKIHIRTHTGYKPLRCKICHRPFGDPSNLNKHVRLHADGSTPYRCELCSKVLVRRRDLDRHMRARHGTSSQDHLRDNTSNVALQQQYANGSRSSHSTSTVTSGIGIARQ